MVDISYNEKAFEMRIIDDGVGFNLENNTEGSYGLKNMRKRAEEMGGILNIISKEGKGTEISIVLPQKYLI
jgi:NarL family two-component system sensor histidine kinase LiaS